MTSLIVTVTNKGAAVSYTTFNEAFATITYPAGERHVSADQIEALRGIETIEAHVRNFDDLCEIVVANRILVSNEISVEWFLPYFPFARHDRRNHAGDGLEIVLALELVAELNVVIADPHSEVAATLTHFPQDSVVSVVRSAGAFDNDPILVVPDAGAAKKAYEWVGSADSVQALKHRDPQTGRLSNFEVITEGLNGRPAIIVDDICDGGGTFLGLAEELRTVHNAGPLTLVVTHGLFTKGLDALTAVFDRIYTFAPTNEAPTTPDTNGVIRLPFHMLYEKGTRR